MFHSNKRNSVAVAVSVCTMPALMQAKLQIYPRKAKLARLLLNTLHECAPLIYASPL